jgi:hypothetical protein
MILKESIGSLVIYGCFVVFFLKSIVMYICISHRILVSKSCDGGCRKLVRCRRLVWECRFHSQWSLSVVMMVMQFTPWSYMWDFVAHLSIRDARNTGHKGTPE